MEVGTALCAMISVPEKTPSNVGQIHATAVGKPRPEGSTGRAQILLVEDDRTITTVMNYFLELEGFDVAVAKDALIGLEIAKRELRQVIVTDLNMPGMDGMAVIKALRADARTQISRF